MLIGKIFRVYFYDEDSVIEGELCSDMINTKDFKVFTEACSFAQDHCNVVGASLIREIEQHMKNSHLSETETGNRWEVTKDDCCFLQDSILPTQ